MGYDVRKRNRKKNLANKKLNVIPLSRGLEMRVSPEDYEWCLDYSWSAIPRNWRRKSDKLCYAVRCWQVLKDNGKISTRQSYFHQEVFKRQGITVKKGYCIDHIDQNPMNCTRENLRIVTNSRNHRNRKDTLKINGKAVLDLVEGTTSSINTVRGRLLGGMSLDHPDILSPHNLCAQPIRSSDGKEFKSGRAAALHHDVTAYAIFQALRLGGKCCGLTWEYIKD